MKVFVDTNVLIDYICKREPFFVSAKGVFAACLLKKIEIIISSLSIVNTLYVGRKHGSTLLKSNLLRLSQIVNFVDLPTTMVLQTLKTEWADYEDALQNVTALENHAECIVTRNKKDFEESSLPIYTPEEFLSQLDMQISTHDTDDGKE